MAYWNNRRTSARSILARVKALAFQRVCNGYLTACILIAMQMPHGAQRWGYLTYAKTCLS